MIPRISITAKISEGENLVLILRPDSLIPAGFFSPEELQFIQQQRENKMDQTPFPRSGNWIVALFLPEITDQPGQLEACRRAGDDLQQWANKQKISNLVLFDVASAREEMLAVAEGMVLGNYQFIKYKTRDSVPHALQEIALISSVIEQRDVTLLNATLSALYFTRDLVNEPYSYMTTAVFARDISERAKKAGLVVDILEKKKLEALQMGGLLGVNRGSKEPPVMIILTYNHPRAKSKQPVVLVGKGIVYDTGGMNLKPEKSMETMKHDMAGGAAVAGAMIAIAEAGLPVHVVGLIPATDNRPGEEAIVSGDILRMHNGMTVEVINTDAEGRLILADALSYAERYKPALTIGLSTLTGSAIRCVGKWAIAGMESHAGEAMQTIKETGFKVHERIIEFPLWSDYKEPLKSEIADIRNLGGPYAGVIIAGKFLQEFAPFPFIHLDIAGPAFLDKRDSYRGEGASGVGVRLLTAFFSS